MSNRSLIELDNAYQSTNELLFILDDLFCFSIEKYERALRKETEKLFKQMHVSEVLFDKAFPQLIWWLLFCHPQEVNSKTIYQDYLEVHNEKWKQTNQIVQNHLTRWLRVIPGFYCVVGRYSNRFFHVRDIFFKRDKKVYIFNENFHPVKTGDVISGLLLPVGENLYTTQGELFHFPVQMVPDLMSMLQQYAEKHVNPMFNYPALLHTIMSMMEKDL
ncbi:hypothetical protein [Oceanobacillus kapialis]|uniref:Uncharacterized protein n=1 Tax=Oceanobacillus kapialis TaxID=481353 RepID=A0ABW5Q3N4_9BACI